MSSVSKLFQATKVGNLNLSHRVVLAPLTRVRATSAHVPSDLALEYYTQRSSIPGSLLITEATNIALKAGGQANAPHIVTEEQVKAWKKITDAVHANGSFIYLQLWAMGRAANPDVLAPKFDLVAPSAIPIKGKESVIPRPLSIPEIKEYVNLYKTAAELAIEKAGFDGVEFHMATGYLPDQFLQDGSNTRSDDYGGSIENRVRFPLEAIEAVTKSIGQERTALRISPWSTFQDMGMKDPKPTYSHFVSRIRDLYPQFSYLHVVESRVDDISGVDPGANSNDFIRKIWQPKPYIAAGGFTRDLAMQASDKTGELVAFGRSYISNPDLALRLEKDVALTQGDRSTYYAPGPKGYTDYPFAEVSK